ncbi:MAG: DUF1109 family protein [Pseudobacteriovorax sp.]|nr:DUF1109 family protein [Pseudobacteriovorax sp.]
MSQHNDILDDLVADLKPFKKSVSFYVYWLLAISLVGMSTAVMLYRSHYVEVSLNSAFIEICVLYLIAIWSFYHAFRFAEPYTHRVSKKEKIAVGALLLSCAGVYISSLTIDTKYFETMTLVRARAEFVCSAEIFLILGLGGAFSLYLFCRLAPFKSDFVASYGVLGLAVTSMMMLRVLCPESAPEHFLIFHYVPAVVGFGIGFVLMKLTLDRGNRFLNKS